MASRIASVLVLAMALAAVSLGGSATASAESYRHRDAKHDVNDAAAAPPCAGCFPIGHAPTRRAEDIVGFGVRFDDAGLHLRLGTRSAPRDASVPTVTWWVHTFEDDYLTVVVRARKHGTVHVKVPEGGDECSDTTARFTNKPRRWSVSLSLACLRGAPSVQVGVVTQHGPYNDDALVDGVTCCQAPALSPKVRRG
jgi:hypothetical protein